MLCWPLDSNDSTRYTWHHDIPSGCFRGRDHGWWHVFLQIIYMIHIHTHRAMQSQVADFLGMVGNLQHRQPRMQCSRQKLQELRQMLQHELVQSPVGEISSGGPFCPLNLLGWAQRRISVCYFFWEVWWEATDFLGPKRFWNRSNFFSNNSWELTLFCANIREKGTSSGRGQSLQCVAYNGKFSNLHSFAQCFETIFTSTWQTNALAHHLSQGIPRLGPCMCAAECLTFGSSNKAQKEKGKTETVPHCEVVLQNWMSQLLFMAHG